jgi:hypothetical protein
MTPFPAAIRFLCVTAALVLMTSPAAAQSGIPGMPGGVLPGFRPPPRVDPAAAVVGTVVSAQDGKPIPKAIVRLQSDRLSQARVADDKGRFYFRNLPAGAFTIVATKTGYLDGAYGQRRAAGSGIPVEIPTPTAVQRITIELFRPSVISGYVVDEANEPLPDVRVVALRRDSSGAVRFVPTSMATLTDDEGYYRLINLEPGEYLVAVPNLHFTMPTDVARDTMPDDARRLFDEDGQNVIMDGGMPTRPPGEGVRKFSYPTSYYATTDRALTAMPVTLDPGEVHAGINLQLRPVPTARISGLVLGAQGTARMRPLTLVRDDDTVIGEGWDVARTLSNEKGEFTFLDVPVGRYILESPVGPSERTTGDEGSAPAAVEWAREVIEVDERGLHDLIVALRPPIDVHVHTTFQSSRSNLNRASLRPPAIVLETERGALLRADGNQDQSDDVIAGLPAGRYDVRVGAPPPGWAISSIKSGITDLAESPLDIIDSSAPGIEITLTDRTGRVAGTVRDARNVPISAAAVIAFPVSRGAWPAAARTRRAQLVRSSHYGAFEVSGLSAGDYFFVAIDDAGATDWQDARMLERLSAGATRVTVAADAQKSVELRLFWPAR